MNRIIVRKTSHFSFSGNKNEHQEKENVRKNEPQLQLTLTDYAGNKSHLSLSQQLLVGHKVRPAIAKDSSKRPGTNGIKFPSQIPGQSPSLTSVEQDWKHQGPEDSDFHPAALVLAVLIDDVIGHVVRQPYF